MCAIVLPFCLLLGFFQDVLVAQNIKTESGTPPVRIVWTVQLEPVSSDVKLGRTAWSCRRVGDPIPWYFARQQEAVDYALAGAARDRTNASKRSDVVIYSRDGKTSWTIVDGANRRVIWCVTWGLFSRKWECILERDFRPTASFPKQAAAIAFVKKRLVDDYPGRPWAMIVYTTSGEVETVEQGGP
jgi:hypothetical protein